MKSAGLAHNRKSINPSYASESGAVAAALILRSHPTEVWMKDPLWQAVYLNLRPMLDRGDMVLAPQGAWPRFPCRSVFYRDLIGVGDCTVLVLHKGFLTSLAKPELSRIAAEWQWIFANDVFIVLSRTERIGRDVRHSAAAIHCAPLIRFLRSASLRRRRARIIYVHVPKTGGTSMWASLARAFPSHAYYSSQRAYLSNPPAPDEYDLIGLHFSPAVLLHSLAEDDWLIGMVRDPTQRFLSGVAHARRPTEDTQTFTASARAMREMKLTDYLATELGRTEVRLQLLTFGSDRCQSGEMPSDEAMLDAALALARRKNVILAPSEQSHAFRNFIAKSLSFRPRALGRLNANEPAMRTAHLPEFEAAGRLIDALNRREREFYAFVCSSFAERQIARPRPGSARRPFSLLYASAKIRAAFG